MIWWVPPFQLKPPFFVISQHLISVYSLYFKGMNIHLATILHFIRTLRFSDVSWQWLKIINPQSGWFSLKKHGSNFCGSFGTLILSHSLIGLIMTDHPSIHTSNYFLDVNQCQSYLQISLVWQTDIPRRLGPDGLRNLRQRADGIHHRRQSFGHLAAK